ncbi:Chloroperoxidase [Pholiota molesta]|nr:Chloroperoxidase [Pholiota molesta]
MTRLFLAFLASILTVDLALAFPSYAHLRRPCPGLNTLASHGWLPRNGIASPSQIITAVQEGFNMGNDIAVFVTYAAHLVDGNLLTDRLSIAIVGGLDTHGVFEGDASTTRADAFFGDNHSFNESLFDELTAFSNKFESVFPLAFFVDGRHENPLHLNMTVARGFFQNSRMPDDFFRSNISWGLDLIGNGIDTIFKPHPIEPGANNGTLNSYTLDPNSASFTNGSCKLYTDFVNITVRSLYPNAKGPLLAALNKNLDFFFGPSQEDAKFRDPFDMNWDVLRPFSLPSARFM